MSQIENTSSLRALPRVSTVPETWYHPGAMGAAWRGFGARIGLSQVSRWSLELASTGGVGANGAVRPPIEYWPWTADVDDEPEPAPRRANAIVHRGLPLTLTSRISPAQAGPTSGSAAVPRRRRDLGRPGAFAAGMRAEVVDPTTLGSAVSRSSPAKAEPVDRMSAFKRMLERTGRIAPEGDNGDVPPPLGAVDAPTSGAREPAAPWRSSYSPGAPARGGVDRPILAVPVPAAAASASGRAADPSATPGPAGRRPGSPGDAVVRRSVSPPGVSGAGLVSSASSVSSLAGRGAGDFRSTTIESSAALRLDPVQASVPTSTVSSVAAPLPLRRRSTSGLLHSASSSVTDSPSPESHFTPTRVALETTATEMPINSRPDGQRSELVGTDDERALSVIPPALLIPADQHTPTVSPEPPTTRLASASPAATRASALAVASPATTAPTPSPATTAPTAPRSDPSPSTRPVDAPRRPTAAFPVTAIPVTAIPATPTTPTSRTSDTTTALRSEAEQLQNPGDRSPGSTSPAPGATASAMPVAPPLSAALVDDSPARSREVADSPAAPRRRWYERPDSSTTVARTPTPPRTPTPTRPVSPTTELRRTEPPEAVDTDNVRSGRRPAVQGDNVRSEQAAQPDSAAAFESVMRTAPAIAARPLPEALRPLAAAIVGHATVTMRTDHVARRALAAAGKRAATTGSVIHLQRTPDAVADRALIAHELTHVASPSPLPRFYDDDRPSVEEYRAEAIARLVQRSPTIRPLASPHDTGASVSGSVQRRVGRQRSASTPAGAGAPTMSPTPLAHRSASAATSTAATVSAADLAARYNGAPASPRPSAASPSRLSVAPAAVVQRRIEIGSHRAARPQPSATPTTNAVSEPQPTAQGRQQLVSSVASNPPANVVATVPTTSAPTERSDPFTEQIADLRSASGSVDFVNWIVEKVEDRLLAEMQRRGGRFRGEF